METKLLKIKGDWIEVLDDCRHSANKAPLNKEPSLKFKKEILISEHSPIRDIIFKWDWIGIKHWVGVHWVRHKWECLLNTQRSDLTNIDRDNLPQDSLQNFRGEANTQHLIDTMRKRLCRKASDETRECAELLKNVIHEYEAEISDVLVPNCIYRGGCPEAKNCGFFEKFYENAILSGVDIINIQNRYDAYNKFIARDTREQQHDK